MKNKMYSVAGGLLAAILLILADQYTKYLAAGSLQRNGSIEIIKGVFELHYLENRGAAFGILQGQRIPFLIIGVVLLVILGYVYTKLPMDKRYHWLRAVVVLMAAGAVGNTIDRLFNGYVVDFLYFKLIDFPVFNVADCYVTVSAIGLILLILFYYKEEDLEFLSRKKKREESI